MEKIVILALVILSYVALSSAHSHTMAVHHDMSTPTAPTPHPNSTMPYASSTPTVTMSSTTTMAPESGAVSFSASAGLIVFLILALLH